MHFNSLQLLFVARRPRRSIRPDQVKSCCCVH